MARVLRALAAVLGGNAVYFLLLFPRLPEWARHEPLTVDPGLLMDLGVCVAIYLLLGRLAPAGRRGT